MTGRIAIAEAKYFGTDATYTRAWGIASVLVSFLLTNWLGSCPMASAADLNTQLQMIETQIAIDHAEGKLTGKQARKLREKLEELQTNVAGLQSSEGTASENSAPAIFKLNAITDDIASQMRMSSKVIDDFDSRAATLDWLIAKAKMGQQLTPEETVAVQDQLDQLRKQHAAARPLTQKDVRTYTRQLLSLHDRIIASMFHRQPTGQAAELDGEIATVRGRLVSELNSDRLSRKEFATMKADLNAIETTEDILRSSKEGLTAAEAEQLTDQIEKIHFDIEQDLKASEELSSIGKNLK